LTIEVDAGGIALEDTISLRIAEQRQVTFTVINSEDLVVGKPTTIQVEVTNAGNIRLEHRVQVEILDGWSARILDATTVDLQQDETRSLDIEITPTSVGQALVRVSLMGDGDSVAFEHSFTLNAESDSSEGTAGGFATTILFGVVFLLILAAAAGIFVLLQRERSEKSAQGATTSGFGPSPAVVGGFEAIVGGLPAPAQVQNSTSALGQTPVSSSSQTPTVGQISASATAQTSVPVPAQTPVQTPVQTPAQMTLPPPPVGETNSREAAVVSSTVATTAVPVVVPTAAEATAVAEAVEGAKVAGKEPETSMATAAEITSEVSAAAATTPTSTPTSAPASATTTAAVPIMCWACAKPNEALTSRGCPGCGARYHPLGPEACAHAEVAACRNCGADSATFVLTNE
jgi:hypothetical protein